MNKKRLMIIGGTKYIGLELIKHLQDFEVHICSRKLTFYEGINEKVMDRKSKKELLGAVRNIQPEIILDMICYDQQDATDMSDILTKNVPCLEHYIMISTFFMYKYSYDLGELSEITLGEINDGYTRGKYLAEKTIFNSGFFEKVTIVRFPFVFSHDDYSGRFQHMLKMVLENRKVWVDNKKCSFIAKTDAAQSLKKLIYRKPQGIINISNEGCIALKDMYSLIADTCDVEIEYVGGERDVYQIKSDLCLAKDKPAWLNLRNIRDAIKSEVMLYLKIVE